MNLIDIIKLFYKRLVIFLIKLMNYVKIIYILNKSLKDKVYKKKLKLQILREIFNLKNFMN